MKLSQLFREIIKEEGCPVDEEDCRYADSMVPEVGAEIPDDLVPRFKEILRQKYHEVNALPDEEIRKRVKQHLTQN